MSDNKPKTIEDLLKFLNQKSVDEADNTTPHKYAYNTVWHWVQENRDDLESNEQKPLRFKKFDSLLGKPWVLVKDDNQPHLNPWSNDFLIVYRNKVLIRHIAMVLGLPCEFIEEDSDNDR